MRRFARERGVFAVELEELAQEGPTMPKNEWGFAMCRTPAGQLRAGPVAHGTPNNVTIDVKCGPGESVAGLFHTHPGGVAEPSQLDLQSALKLKNAGRGNVLCIDADGDLKCFRVKPRR